LVKEIEVLAKKVEFLNGLSEEELDSFMFYFANCGDNGSPAASEEALAECEAYGVDWEEIVSSMIKLREREYIFNKISPMPNANIYWVIAPYAKALSSGGDVFDKMTDALSTQCGVSRDAMLALEIAYEALSANKMHYESEEHNVYAGRGTLYTLSVQ